jgi:ribonuclease III
MKEKMKELAAILNYEYQNIDYLYEAMNVKLIGKKTYKNESMATFGDSLLDMVISLIYFKEGLNKKEVTDRRSELVNNKVLFETFKKLDIKHYIHNEVTFYKENVKDNEKLSFKSHNQFLESIAGAIFLDLGYEKAERWILDFLVPKLIENRKQLIACQELSLPRI